MFYVFALAKLRFRANKQVADFYRLSSPGIIFLLLIVLMLLFPAVLMGEAGTGNVLKCAIDASINANTNILFTVRSTTPLFLERAGDVGDT